MNQPKSQAPLRIAVVLGTRPELLKLAPVIAELEKHSPQLHTQVIFTGQHRELLHGLPELFALAPYRQLALRNERPNLTALTAGLIQELDAVLGAEPCDAVVVQGDTTTAFCAALAGFYRQIPVAHVEAGLRTFDKREPFPEELNRQLVARLARWHFAPTPAAERHLLAENIDPMSIEVTGNTIVDTLQWVVRERIPSDYASAQLAVEAPELATALAAFEHQRGQTLALLTLHRRENQGPRLQGFFAMLRELAAAHPGLHLIYPYHLNPEVRGPAQAALGDLANVHLVAPLSYRPMVYLMSQVAFAMSDSGGLQEEFPTFSKPLLVLRDATERPELLDAGMGKLVGVEPEVVRPAVRELLTALQAGEQPPWYRSGANPFGDGRASQRIVARLIKDLTQPSPLPHSQPHAAL